MKSKYINFNIANFLSISRIFACFPLIVCLYRIENINYKYYSIFFVLFIVISDILDGFFARRYKQVTDLGKIIDPVADKICFMTLLIYLIDKYDSPFLFFIVLLYIRDFILMIFSLYFILYTKYVPEANKMGKLFIFSSVLMIIFHIYPNLNENIANILYFVSLCLLFISGAIYIRNHLIRLKS